MQLTFITDEVSQDVAAICHFAWAEGISAIELRTVNGKSICDTSTDECFDLKCKLDERGMSVCCLASPVFKGALRADLTEHFDVLNRVLRAAIIFQCPFVRVFSFWREDRGNIVDPAIVCALRNASQLAGNAGVQLLIENGRRTRHVTAADLVELIPKLDMSQIGILWDPGNPIYGGVQSNPLAEPFRDIIPFIRHVHIKDPIYHSESERWYGPFGKGQLDIRKLIELLRCGDYRGFLSVETHWRPDRVFSSSELDHPGGHGFSEGGLEATAHSLRYMREML